RRQAGERPCAEDYQERLAGLDVSWLTEFLAGAGQATPAGTSGGTVAIAAGPEEASLQGGRGTAFGDYELRGVIARGGVGWFARPGQPSPGRPVALKMTPSAALASPEELARSRGEALASARLDHPHIVPVYEVGTHEGQPYFSMKLIEGGS